MTKNLTAAIAALGLAVCMAGSAHASGPNLVTNGDFSSLTAGPGQLGYNTDATGWTTTGYNFVFAPGTADTTGSNGYYGALKLWGPGNGENNGLTASSPDGGNFVGADGAFGVDPISQTITGLTVGQKYTVGFYWAAAQQQGFSGKTTDKWTVSLGGVSHDTTTAFLPNHGFSPWEYKSFDYTATSSSEVLSFLATGTPSGVPPFALLDGVSVTATPESSSMIAMFAGVMFFGVFMFRRGRTSKSAA